MSRKTTLKKSSEQTRQEIEEVAKMTVDLSAEGRFRAAMSPDGKMFEEYEGKISIMKKSFNQPSS